MSEPESHDPEPRPTAEVTTLPGRTLREEDDGWCDDTAIGAPPSAELPGADPSQRYELERELGRGGMGTVSLHLDRRIGRRIAVKTLHPEIANIAQAKARFLREACVQGQLEHPAVVPVYDIGEGAERSLYFTMKRVRGVTLEEIFRRRGARDGAALDEARYGTRRLLDAFASVCLAVDFAHRRGVLHRDLKPANVMLGDFGEVYVLDWGLAHLTDGDVTASADRVVAAGAANTATQPGTVLGTPGYMAPEQARGEAVSPASDVYSLGALLFELLAGEPLHLGTAVPVLIVSTLDGADARASRRVPAAQVPPELEEICVRATSARPSERYASAREVERAVRRYLDGERDVARRKELAEEHVTLAREAVHQAREGSAPVDARRLAMQAIGRALAFEPGSPGAMAALAELLSSPPATIPPEVRLDMEDSQSRRMRWIGRVGMYGYASMFLYIPFLLWAGVRSPAVVVFFFACMAGCVALSAWASQRNSPSTTIVLACMLLSNVALVATAGFYGPFVITPPALVANTAAYAVYLEGKDRLAAIGMGAVAFLLALAGSFSGVLPGGVAFGPEGMTILTGALAMPELPTSMLLAAFGLGVVLLGSISVVRLRDDLTRAERDLLLYAWHLREIVPAGVRQKTDPTAARRERSA